MYVINNKSAKNSGMNKPSVCREFYTNRDERWIDAKNIRDKK